MSREMSEADFFANLHEPCPYPVGTRIRLTKMLNDPDPVPVGSTGVVSGGNGAQMYVDWDNGRSLIFLVGEDECEVIS